jgi:hypothetical protein
MWPILCTPYAGAPRAGLADWAIGGRQTLYINPMRAQVSPAEWDARAGSIQVMRKSPRCLTCVVKYDNITE